MQDYVERRVKEIAEGVALALGGRAEVNYQRGYPVTVNAEDNTRYAADVARAVSGKVDEDTAPQPRSVYGRTKRAAEELLSDTLALSNRTLGTNRESLACLHRVQTRHS